MSTTRKQKTTTTKAMSLMDHVDKEAFTGTNVL